MTQKGSEPSTSRVAYEALLGILEEAVALVDAEGRFRYVSPALERLLGRNPAACVGLDAFRNLHPEDADRTRLAFGELASRPGGTAELRVRARHADGTYRWFRLFARNLLDVPGVEAVAVSFRDAEEERRAEDEVAAREERLRLAREAARLGFWTYDVFRDHLRIEYASDLAIAIDPVAGTSFLNWVLAVHPEDREAASTLVDEALRGLRDTYSCEVRVRDQTGDWRWLAIYGSVVGRQANGLPRLIVGTYQDVTERRQAEERLRESEERYRLLAEAQFAAVYESTAEGGITWSRGLTEVFGYKPEELPTWQAWFAHVHPQDADRVRASLGRFHAERRTIWQEEYRYRHADGSYRYARERAYALRHGDGTAYRMVGAIADVTAERLAAEAELERRKFESLTEMAAGIAHDFNNLLTAILGNASMARLALGEGDRQILEALEDIEAAARRAAGLVRQMLDFAGAGKAVRGVCDLNELVREAWAILRGTMGRRIGVVLDLAQEPVRVRGDEEALLRVLVNLVANAREAIGEEIGRVTLRTGVVDIDRDELRAGGWMAVANVTPGRFGFVEVADTGVGIRPELLGRIFDPFYSTKFAGRGLGLASVLGVVRRHAGTVRVRSTLGAGSTFTVAIPLAEGVTAEQL